MKTRFLIIITGILAGTGMIMFAFDDDYTNDAYGMWFPLSPEDLIEQSRTIFVGTVTAVTPVDVEYQSQIAIDGTIKDNVGPEVITLEEYTVDVEEFLKNPQDSDTMKVLSATVGGVPSGPARIDGFEIGDRVLFYLPKDERQTHFVNQYLPESFQIPKQCDAKTVLEKPKIIGANDFRMMQDGIVLQNNFTANKKLQFVFDKDLRTLAGSGFTVDVVISKMLDKNEHQTVLEESIHAESQQCEWIATAQWDFVPAAGEYSMWMSYAEDGDSGSSTSNSGFSVVEDLTFSRHDGITLRIEPKQLKFEESFTINATAYNYQNNDQWYFISVIDPNGKEIFSTIWYTYAQFVFQIRTGSPHYEFYTNGEYTVTVELAEHNTEKRTGHIIKQEFFTVSEIPDGIADKPKEFGATGRSISAFRFEVDDYYLHGNHAYFVAEPGSKSIMPITVKNKGQSYTFAFHPTFGDQLNPPSQPDGINIRFEPSYLELEPKEEKTINLVIDLDRNTKPTVYDVGMVGFWKEPGGFMGSSIRLHVGDYFGPRALPSNFEFPSPLWMYKETGDSKNIECKGGKRLVTKESNGHPACVNFESIAKLIDRGWVKSGMQFLHVADLKPVYYADEEISFGVHKIGLINCDWITVKIFDQDDSDKEKLLHIDTTDRICLKEARSVDSPEKTWKLYTDFPQNEIESIVLKPGNYIMQISSDGVTTMDREFRVIERMIENEN